MKQQLSFDITQMHCASCVARVEDKLRTVRGITDVAVNLANHRATVQTDGSVAARDVIGHLSDIGKPAQIEQITLNISGMSCASCVAQIEKSLQNLPFVIDVKVDLMAETARVNMLSTDTGALIDAVAQTGKTARLADGPGTTTPDHSTQLKQNLILAAALTAPVFVLEMGSHLIPGLHHLIARTIGIEVSWFIQFALTSLILILPGRGFFTTGFPALFKGAPDMNSLVALGTSAAYAFSVIALFAPTLLPDGTRAVYFEAAAVIITLILLGRWLEAKAKARTGDAIRKLIDLSPKTARVETNGDLRDVPVGDLQLDDIIHVRPGERLAVDGIVTGGESYVDESMITGEPVPVAKSSGDTVTSGTINTAGALRFRATAVGAQTRLSQIVEMVQKAQATRLPVQDLVNRITGWFVPAVLTVAVLTIVTWLIFGPDPVLSYALVAGISVLIVACPCAMGLAVPTSIMVGMGRAAEKGVLFRNGDALQKLRDVKTIVFDKTGTLTVGTPALDRIEIVGDISDEEALRLAAAAEMLSEHPLAKAIVQAADTRDISRSKANHFHAVIGQGITATVEDKDIAIGSLRFLKELNIEVQPLTSKTPGATQIHMAVDRQHVAVFLISDTIRPEARDLIELLKAQGLMTAMVTGDAESTAKHVANQLGIDHVVAGVLPAGKVAAIRDLQKDGPVAFVGDGINDAPALAAADVGIAIGTGTDIAIETADLVTMSENLNTVKHAIDISRASLRNIHQNLFWAFGYNTLLIPVAAGLLFPLFGLLLSPAFAAGAMALSSVFVVGNALRLRKLAL
ncbi:heavy metal translocating P-type ATPase [Pseudaestuariivita rosea]|uniref:heavy metal translocating P-type ATPase n=1 Tax=Pseudaestuariivita rosea TaxID=2763263 RepID=UPI001ABA1135|nr:heavy metal translocating P-type ATPase [Pseudaestuariivita rosea]